MTRISAVPMLAFLAACAPSGGPDVTRLIEPSVIQSTDVAPSSSEPDICWGHEPGPDVTRIVDETVLVEEAKTDASGTEVSPAIYRKMSVPQTMTDGDGRWFKRVCDAKLTPPFVETLQRALEARGVFEGPITGLLDAATRTAIRNYQEAQGLSSDLLSVAAGEQLGLVALVLEPVDVTPLEGSPEG